MRLVCEGDFGVRGRKTGWGSEQIMPSLACFVRNETSGRWFDMLLESPAKLSGDAVGASDGGAIPLLKPISGEFRVPAEERIVESVT